jgi:hypothetical protein
VVRRCFSAQHRRPSWSDRTFGPFLQLELSTLTAQDLPLPCLASGFLRASSPVSLLVRPISVSLFKVLAASAEGRPTLDVRNVLLTG